MFLQSYYINSVTYKESTWIIVSFTYIILHYDRVPDLIYKVIEYLIYKKYTK